MVADVGRGVGPILVVTTETRMFIGRRSHVHMSNESPPLRKVTEHHKHPLSYGYCRHRRTRLREPGYRNWSPMSRVGKDKFCVLTESLYPGTKRFPQGSEKRDEANDLRGDPEFETPRQSSDMLTVLHRPNAKYNYHILHDCSGPEAKVLPSTCLFVIALTIRP
jgi:hypothetical protein